MLLWKTKNKTKQTNKSTAIFHGLYSYRPQKWRQNVQNFAVKPLADISYERATWAFFLVLLACVLGDKAGLCVGNLFWGKKTIKHVSEDTFSDQSSNGKGRKTAIASPKVSWELKVIHAPINVKPAGGRAFDRSYSPGEENIESFFVWRGTDVGIFDCRLWRKRLRPNIHASRTRRTVWKDLEITEANENKPKVSGFHCIDQFNRLRYCGIKANGNQVDLCKYNWSVYGWHLLQSLYKLSL